MTVVDAVYVGLVCAFFAYIVFGMRKTSRYDDPEYLRKQDEYAERTLAAAEKQADALDRIARRP